MSSDNLTPIRQRLASPAVLLALGLVLAAALGACPAGWIAAAKSGVGSVLRPGQVAMGELRKQGRWCVAWVRNRLATADQLGQLQWRNAELEAENRRLAAQLAVLESRQQSGVAHAGEDERDRLLTTRGVKARVLGRSARGFLTQQQILDVGSKASIQPDALVIDDQAGLIDQGGNAALEVEQLVLSRGRVWGKVMEVGAQTSTVRRVTEPGYRDLVRLATPAEDGEEIRFGPQGIVEGTGEPLARVRLVEVTEPVSLGDLVYTAAAKGVLPEPLFYGRIVRLQRPVGAAHWEIWMEPAVPAHEPETVIVLRTEINPARR